MARRLIDRNRAREARRQVLLLDRLTRQFRGRVERELSSAMGEMVDRWELTREVMMPRGFAERMAATYEQMAIASIEAFSRRIVEQGKAAGLILKVKEDFAQIMRRRALRYIQQEAVRRRIQRVTETTRRQIVNAVDTGYRDGSTLPEVASSIRSIIPALASYRADAIARTETHGAANYGSQEAAAATGLPLRKEWLAAQDERTRETHAEADGQIVGMDDGFKVGNAILMYPGDPAGPPEETVNCFAPWSNIHVGGLRAAMRRNYVGDLIELSVGGPVDLTVTPNHPVLTARGWVAAGEIMEGDQLVQGKTADFFGSLIYPNERYGLAKAHELYDLAQALARPVRSNGIVVNLHGEMIPCEDINIIPFKSELRAAWNAPEFKLLADFSLTEADISAGLLLSRRMIGLGAAVSPQEPDCGMSGSGAGRTLFGGQEFSGTGVAFANTRQGDAQVMEAIVDHRSGNANFGSDAVDRVSTFKKPSDIGVMPRPGSGVNPPHSFRGEFSVVRSFRRFHYSGPVFNFESNNGLLLSDGIITHNCRCTLGYIVDDGIDDWVDPYETPAALT